MVESYLVYNFILLLPVLLFLFHEKIRIPDSLPYLIIILFSIIRFDIGYDYDGMVKLFKIYSSSNNFTFLSKEPTYYYLCKAFSFYSRGYIFILAIYFIASLYFLRKIAVYYEIENQVLFVFITMCFMFETFDRVRQSLAVLIFIFSFRFIDQNNLRKYLFGLFVATLIHYSAILVFPFYWLARLPLKKNTLYILFFTFCVLFYFGFWASIRHSLFSIIPVYGDIYVKRSQYLMSVETNSGLGVLFAIVMFIIPLILLPNTKENRIIINAIFWGSLIYFFSSGNLLIERVSQYFTFANIIALSLLCKARRINTLILGSVLFIWFQASIYMNRSGCFPYKTIFSKDAQVEKFKMNVKVKYLKE